MDTADEVVKKKLKYTKGIDKITLISGISGVFCTYTEKVKDAAKIYNLDPRDIFMALGKKKVVGGQEDMILEVVKEIMNNNKGE